MSYASFATGEPETSRIVVAASSLIGASRELRISSVTGSSRVALPGRRRVDQAVAPLAAWFAASSLEHLVDGEDVGELLDQDVQRGLVLLVAQRRRRVTEDDDAEVDHHAVARGGLDADVRLGAGEDDRVAAHAAQQALEARRARDEARVPVLDDDVVRLLDVHLGVELRAPRVGRQMRGSRVRAVRPHEVIEEMAPVAAVSRMVRADPDDRDTPSSRQPCAARLIGSTISCADATGIGPSGSRNAFCMSMITSAVFSGSRSLKIRRSPRIPSSRSLTKSETPTPLCANRRPLTQSQ